MNQLTENQPHNSSLNLKRILMFAVLLVYVFWNTDHSFSASDRMKFAEAYDGTANYTADKLNTVNPMSTLSRLVLAALGAYFLLQPTKLDLRWTSFLLFLAFALFLYTWTTVLWAQSASYTFKKMVVVTTVVVAAAGFARHFTLRDLGILFAITGCSFCVIGVLVEASLGNFRPDQPRYRFTGTAHPNTLSIYGAIMCLTAGLFTPAGKKLGWQTLVIFLGGIMILLATKSRTSLAGTLLASGVIFSLKFRGANRFMLIAGAGASLAIGGFAFSVLGTKTLGAVGNTAAMGRSSNVSTLTGRLPLWEELITHIEKKPVLGHGYLSFWTEDQVDRISGIFNWEIPHGHNIYLDIMLDGGIISLVLYASILLTGIVLATRYYGKTGDRGAAFACGMIIYALVNGFGESLFKLMGFPSFVLITCLLRLGQLPTNASRVETESDTDLSLPGWARSSATMPFEHTQVELSQPAGTVVASDEA